MLVDGERLANHGRVAAAHTHLSWACPACHRRFPRPPDRQVACPSCRAGRLVDLTGPGAARLFQPSPRWRPGFAQRALMVFAYWLVLALALVEATGLWVVLVGTTMFTIVGWLSVARMSPALEPDAEAPGRWARFRVLVAHRSDWMVRRFDRWWALALLLVLAGATLALWRWPAGALQPAPGHPVAVALATVMFVPILALVTVGLAELVLMAWPLAAIYAVVVALAVGQQILLVVGGDLAAWVVPAELAGFFALVLVTDVMRAGYTTLRDEGLLRSLPRVRVGERRSPKAGDGPDARTLRGVIEAVDPPFTAPLSGAPCLAWRVHGGDARWEVNDGRCAERFVLKTDDGERLEVQLEQAWLEIPTAAGVAATEVPAVLATFLSERGVTLEGPSLREACIAEGDRVQLTALPQTRVVPRGFRSDEETVLVGPPGAGACLRRLDA